MFVVSVRSHGTLRRGDWIECSVMKSCFGTTTALIPLALLTGVLLTGCENPQDSDREKSLARESSVSSSFRSELNTPQSSETQTSSSELPGPGEGVSSSQVSQSVESEASSSLSASSGAFSVPPSSSAGVSTSSPPSVSSSSSMSVPEADLYKSFVEPNIVQARCVKCHAAGLRSGMTRLVFAPGEGRDDYNRDVFNRFVTQVPDGGELILNKVRGSAHGGGTVFPSGTHEYGVLAEFLGELVDREVDPLPVSSSNVFEKLVLENESATLRRAAILFSGQVPDDEQLAAVDGDEFALREAIRHSMQGAGFHDFLLRGANDRLLTDAFFAGKTLEVMNPTAFAYPLLADRNVYASEQGGEIAEEYDDWRNRLKYGVARAPLELIAYVVENDRPYTEVLTADYTMVNPYSAEVYNTNVDFEDPTDINEFHPAQNRGQILRDAFFDSESISGIGRVIYSHGEFLEYPHAGVLNEPAFLNRYPSTETNRNRARARWTFYHFLGVDIEKSASRTNDPEALADTNNPTMNNHHCTVCHEVMDPVAGAFQNYGDFGFYRDSPGGLDSLPKAYKRKENSPYHEGDLWYRDMRLPGFEGQQLGEGNRERGLQWLANRIVQDERFAKATVKFWWSAVMSEPLLDAPENSGDADYVERFAGFEAQQAVIDDLAAGFRQGFHGGVPYNLKDLLVEMTMTSWFRASAAVTPLSESESKQLVGVGKERLLTPEELEAKTRSLLGAAWGEEFDASWSMDGHHSELQDTMRIYYGGIDSFGITERARAMNSLMSNVAMAQAVSVSCPAVILDFNRPASERLLFKHVDRYTTPGVRAREQFTVVGTSDDDWTFRRTYVPLEQGDHVLRLSFDNPYWDSEARVLQSLVIHTIRVKTSSGSALVALDGHELEDQGGWVSTDAEGNPTGRMFRSPESGERNGWLLREGYIEIPFHLPFDDEVELSVQATRRDVTDRELLMGMSIMSPDGSARFGEEKLRRQLQYLHYRLLGEQLDLYDEEITASYALLMELRNERKTRGFAQQAVSHAQENCEMGIDDWWSADRSNELIDPEYMQGAWISMLIYFLTDYHYLHE